MGKTLIPLQVDVGFGDVITPSPRTESLATLLDMPAPVVKTYPRETFVAEKFEAMVGLGDRNTRLKDFADMAWISMHEAFDGALLHEACMNTFEHRGTPVVDRETPAALLPAFYADRRRLNQWSSFTADITAIHSLGSFPEVGETLRRFLEPLWRAMTSPDERDRLRIGSWNPPGPWRARAGGLEE